MSAICSHTDSIKLTELPDEIAGCTDCLAIGGRWLHLRMCHPAATSRAATARRPARLRPRPQLQHPIVRSAEPGEDWSWCYLDNVTFVVSGR